MLLELGAVVLGSILRAAVRMMDAARRRPSAGDGRYECREREPRIDAPADLVGLAGELCFIWQARGPIAAAKAWRIDPDEQFDFLSGSLRVDVKSGNRQRTHGLSFEQAKPPGGTVGIIGSVLESAGGGISLGDLLSALERKLAASEEAIVRIPTVVASTLGSALLTSMAWRFDLALAESSMQFFDAAETTAIRAPLPVGVSGVRFNADLGGIASIDIAQLEERLQGAERALLPVVGRL